MDTVDEDDIKAMKIFAAFYVKTNQSKIKEIANKIMG